MHIAVIDDDPIQRHILQSWLEEESHDCRSFCDCRQFLQADHIEDIDLFIFDWELPDRTGIELLQEVRNRYGINKGVIFLSQRDAEGDIVKALECGADDYLVKPAKRQELMARIQAVARRHPNDGGKGAEATHEHYPPFTFAKRQRQLLIEGRPVDLTRKEYNLAYLLFQNHNAVIERETIYHRVWNTTSEVNTRTIDTHISRLRKKLDLYPENGWLLSAIYQRGYRLERIS